MQGERSGQAALIEVQVTFDSEVKAELFMNRRGTIVGPEEVKN